MHAHMKAHYARIARLARIAAPARNPALLAAQFRVFAGQLPVMYLILISSTWSLAVTHLGSTPWWLSVAMPAAMMLTVTNWLVIPIAATFTTWALLLFPYGDAWQKAQVAFFLSTHEPTLVATAINMACSSAACSPIRRTCRIAPASG